MPGRHIGNGMLATTSTRAKSPLYPCKIPPVDIRYPPIDGCNLQKAVELSLHMRTGASFIRPARYFWLMLLLSIFAPKGNTTAQGSTEHLPGKVYVIRVSPFASDTATLETVLKYQIEPVLSGGKGMFDHVRSNLYRMQSASHGQWFIGYFHPDRQEKEILMRDSDLLIWLFHGHDVQIMPIETLKSPVHDLLATPARK